MSRICTASKASVLRRTLLKSLFNNNNKSCDGPDVLNNEHIPYGNKGPYCIPDGPDVLANPTLRQNEHKEAVLLTEIQFDHIDFRECLDKLSNGAAPGPDGIPASMLKGAKNTVSILLNNILKSSYESGCIPACHYVHKLS